MTPCAHCSRLTTTVICWNCAVLLRRQLAELPWYLQRLQEAAYGQAKLAPRGAVRAATCDMPSLPLNERATKLLSQCRAWLASWFLEFHPAAPVPSSEACAALLAGMVGTLLGNPGVGEMLTMALDLREQCEAIVDLPASRRLAGLCPLCDQAVYAVDDNAAVECAECGAQAFVSSVRDRGIEEIRESPRSRADMWRIVQWTGRKGISQRTLYRLIDREVLMADYGEDGTGAIPLYRWRDVEAALDARDERLRLQAEERKRLAALDSSSLVTLDSPA